MTSESSMEVDSRSPLEEYKIPNPQESFIRKKDWTEEVEPEKIQSIIFSYLVQHCHSGTAKAFAECCSMKPEMVPFEAILIRKRILECIGNGKVVEGIQLTHQHFPELLFSKMEINFKLQCQVFIELIRDRNVDEALKFAQEKLGPFGIMSKDCYELLQDVMALIAYEVPETSPLGHLMTESYREEVSNLLNSAMLEAQKMPAVAILERHMKQLTVVQDTIQLEHKIRGARWSLHESLEDNSKMEDIDKG